MAKSGKSPSRLVYSTELGRLCPQCQRRLNACVCGQDRPAAGGDGVVRIRRETKGRGGKAVTVITGIPLAAGALKDLAKQLKKRCGVGGSAKHESIEIQGDQREILKLELEQRGYTVNLSGG